MSRKIVVLETSAAIQGLIKEKLGNKNVELSFEDKGLKLLVSVYNSIPSAILINASSQNPKASLLVRLIKSIEKLEKVPVGIYSTGEFVFEENFRNSCGADLFININDIEEKAGLIVFKGECCAPNIEEELSDLINEKYDHLDVQFFDGDEHVYDVLIGVI